MVFIEGMRRCVLLVFLVVLIVPAAVHAAGSSQGEISQAARTTGNGRLLKPLGRLTGVGNFPTGSALTPDRRYLWVVDSGHGQDDVRIVRLADGAVTQTLRLPGAFGGVAIAPDGRTAYVSGTPDNPAQPSGTAGAEGDVLHVFTIDPATGLATEGTPLTLPPSSGGTGQTNSLPPVSALYPAGVAISPDGKRVGVALQQADRVAILDVASGTFASVAVGRYPTTVAFDHKGNLWTANLYDGTLTEIDPGGSVTATVGGLGGDLGDRNAHPAGMAMDPTANRLYVAVAQRDLLAVVDTEQRKVVKTVSVGRAGQPLGVSPVDVAVDRDNVYVADANEDTVAVLARRARSGKKQRTVYRVPKVRALRRYARASRPKRRTLRHSVRLRALKACAGPTHRQARRYVRRSIKRLRRHRKAPRAPHKVRRCTGAIAAAPFELIGKIPTAAYPAAVETTGPGRLVWVAAKGFGTGANPQYSFDLGQVAGGNITTPIYGQYVLDALNGIVGVTGRLTDKKVRAGSAKASAQAVPTNAGAGPAGTPVRAGGPIKHVFVIVRENRTYDQVFGSDPRGDGDPALELFDDNGVAGPTGGITPNAHALTRRFPLLDHVYSDSEVSVDGHLITAGSIANDYVQQSTAQNYSRPGKAYDFGIAPITFGPNFFLFDQAVKQNISFLNYGEQAAGVLPIGADGRPTYDAVIANSNLAYPGPVQIGCLAPLGPGGNLASCFQDSGIVGTTGTVTAATSRVNIFNRQFSQQVATGSVPAFNYLVVPNDHTNGTTPNTYTPQALIADNDLGVGQMVDIISHSSVWGSSAILVEEDDSQDGADHVDAHRQPAFVISPWSKGGVEVPTRYDQYSIMATAERILGLKPLSTNDALATPMYDAFISGNEKPNLAPYTAIQPQHPLNEINPSGGRMAALSTAMPFVGDLDLIPQAVSDAILYSAVFGSLDGFSGPGPRASEAEHARAVGALRAVSAGRSARAWLERHGGEADDEEDEDDSPQGRRALRLVRRPKLTVPQRSQAAAEARGALEAIGR